MTNLELGGAMTALITPFTTDGDLDLDALRALVRRQIDGGIDGLVPCGTTGEAATMTADEQIQVIETVVDEAAGRVPIIAGTGSNDTRATIAHTRRVAQIEGVDAALVVTPYYNKPGQAELIRHFQEVADQGGLPVVLYNVPSRTGVSLTAATVAELAEHDQIIAIKEASADLALDSAIEASTPDDFALLSGDDFTTFPLVAIGGRGCISVVSNLWPGEMSAMVAAAIDGDLEEARRIHRGVQTLARALFERANPIPVKAAAHLLGWCEPTLRGPLYAADDALLASLRKTLDACGLT